VLYYTLYTKSYFLFLEKMSHTIELDSTEVPDQNILVLDFIVRSPYEWDDKKLNLLNINLSFLCKPGLSTHILNAASIFSKIIYIRIRMNISNVDCSPFAIKKHIEAALIVVDTNNEPVLM
jgi:hypothetical protein